DGPTAHRRFARSILPLLAALGLAASGSRAQDCGAGSGPAPALLVDGSPGEPGTRVVSVGLGEPLAISLATPAPGRYVLWRWAGPGSNPTELTAGSVSIGCTVNPTPASPGASPQPILCLRSAGIPSRACAGVREIPSPPAAPFTIAVRRGVVRPLVV